MSSESDRKMLTLKIFLRYYVIITLSCLASIGRVCSFSPNSMRARSNHRNVPVSYNSKPILSSSSPIIYKFSDWVLSQKKYSPLFLALESSSKSTSDVDKETGEISSNMNKSQVEQILADIHSGSFSFRIVVSKASRLSFKFLFLSHYIEISQSNHAYLLNWFHYFGGIRSLAMVQY